MSSIWIDDNNKNKAKAGKIYKNQWNLSNRSERFQRNVLPILRLMLNIGHRTSVFYLPNM